MSGRLAPILFTSLATITNLAARQSGPVVPGLGGSHPLEEAQVGEVLMAELGCAACHDMGPDALAPKPAPKLDDVGSRVSAAHMRKLLVDPPGAHAGTSMPAMLDGLPESERAEVAAALAHYLVECSPRPLVSEPAHEAAAERGKALFHTVGCVTCHAPREPHALGAKPTPDPGAAVSLEHVGEKYTVPSLQEFLFQPLEARPGGRMPDMGLSTGEARDLASYLIGADLIGDGAAPPPDETSATLAAAGEKHFSGLGCAACHALEGAQIPRRAPPRAELDPTRGCLAPDPRGLPDFHLDDAQRAAIARALAAPGSTASDAGRVDATLTTFNCYGCHARGDVGGVRAELDPYFTTSELDLGNEARIPPQLTLAGAKLQLEWTQRVLFDGENVRAYMHTRMPQFGEANLAHLPELLGRVDELEPYATSQLEGEAQKAAREGGRQLLGNTGLACVSCHDFNGKPGPVRRGVDLITSNERLHYSWFARFLISPQKFRPGIVMPESWPGGVAAHTEILGGDTPKQVQAIWYFLSLGRSAADPPGISSKGSKLIVTDTVRTYRGRSRVAGYRGIAVGFPGGLSYAFNAQTGTLSAIWSGEFVSVRWGGQGAGDFHPASRALELAQDVSFHRLASEDEPWPLQPRMDKENPVNPDPLYPRNRGYRFRGYFLDPSDVPTFLYESGGVAIEDRSVADLSGERPVLRRELRFSASAADRVFFRALTGEIEATGGGFRTPDLGLTLSSGRTVVRPTQKEGELELLVELELPSGDSEWTVEYEMLR
ncbi:MAG: c-type cytochrome [bacterium]|nr:c-type cytochrome [bacterium]